MFLQLTQMAFSWFKNKQTKEHFILEIENESLNVFIYHEKRNNSRISFGKKGITIRLSNFLTENQKKAQTENFLTWAKNKIRQKPQLLQQDKPKKKYETGQKINLFDRDFNVNLKETSTQKASIKLHDSDIVFMLPKSNSEKIKQAICSELMVRFLRKFYQPIIKEKLNIYNNTYNFGMLNQVRLKNNATNWGSCSSKGNINISVRLFFAPENVVNYVLLHELAHLKHPNHSKDFWDLVEKICPNYKEYEVWLKQNAHLCNI